MTQVYEMDHEASHICPLILVWNLTVWKICKRFDCSVLSTSSWSGLENCWKWLFARACITARWLLSLI